jgi:hypothetical protein
MDAVNPLQLGWALAGFGVIMWFVIRRRRLGPMTRGVMVGYAALLGASATAVTYVLGATLPGAIPAGVLVAVVAYLALARS